MVRTVGIRGADGGLAVRTVVLGVEEEDVS